MDEEAPLNPTSYLKGLTWIPHIMSLGMLKNGRNSLPKWMPLPDWQGKCKQRGASPGNNEFGDFPRAGVRAWTEGWVFKGCVGRDPDPHLQGKVFREVEGERVRTELLVLGDRAA